jgi:hypothetical protein
MKGKIEEEKLFTIIEGLALNTKDYAEEIQRQIWAQKKSQVLQIYLE